MKNIFLILIVMCLCACQRDHLYYEVEKEYAVHVDVDWSACDVRDCLNGLTVIAYKDGLLYKKFNTFSTVEGFDVMLPEGKYKLVVFNNSIDEFYSYCSFSNIENYEEFCIRGWFNSEETEKMNTTYNKTGKCINHIDCLAVGEFDLDNNQGGNDYFYDRPESGYVYEHKKLVLKPVQISRNINIIVNVHGMKYSKGLLTSYLSGCNNGYYVSGLKSNDENIVYPFKMKVKEYGDTQSDVTLGNTFKIFKINTSGNNYHIDINFLLVDNTIYNASFDVSQQINDYIINGSDIDAVIDIDIELDINIPYAEDSDRGGFVTDLEPWSDLIQNIII